MRKLIALIATVGVMAIQPNVGMGLSRSRGSGAGMGMGAGMNRGQFSKVHKFVT